jgi:protein O-mannosyl-transferase
MAQRLPALPLHNPTMGTSVGLRKAGRRARVTEPAHEPLAAPIWSIVALIVVTVGVYLNTLGNDFSLDDIHIIVRNIRIRQPFDFNAIWLTPYWPNLGVEAGLWRPVTVFGFSLQWAIGGGGPAVFHAVSVALHVTVVVLSFLFLRQLVSLPGAFAGALVFAVHPVHSEAVASIVGQAELIAAACVIGACLIHSMRRSEPSADKPADRRHAFALAVLFAIGLLAKEHAVVLPALLVITDMAQRRGPSTFPAAQRYVRLLAPTIALLAVVLVLYVFGRLVVLEGNVLGGNVAANVSYLTGESRLLNALQAVPKVLKLLVFPTTMAFDYSPGMFAPAEGITAPVIAGAALLAAIVAMALTLPLRPSVGLPAAWLVVTLLPVSNLLFPTGIFVAERTLYLPSLAVSAGVAYAIARLFELHGTVPRRMAVACVATLVLVAGARTWIRTGDWRDTDSIIGALVRDHPASYRAQWALATHAMERGDNMLARRHYEAAVATWANDLGLRSEYGNFLMAQGEVEEAVQHFERAYEILPALPRTTVFLGTAYLATERFTHALHLADAAEESGFGVAIHASLRGAAHDGLGNRELALASWQKVLEAGQLNPPVLWAFFARTLARRSAVQPSLHALERGREALARDPSGLRLLSQVQAAVLDGCYSRGHHEHESAISGSCDPLAGPVQAPGFEIGGDWFSPLNR